MADLADGRIWLMAGGEHESLGAGWHAHADEWIAWARTGLDSYDQFHREVFLPLVPAPGLLTVDVGCGEGRLSRHLRALGHRVLAVDLSPRMARAAATHSQNPVSAVIADARRLPVPDGGADCVVAFMALHDTDDMPAAVAEIARVLSPAGRFVLAIVHPLNSVGAFAPAMADGAERPFVISRSYLRSWRYSSTFSRDGLNMTFHGEHRPLQAYTRALAEAGFVIEQLHEPTDPDPGSPWQRIPLFLHIVAVRR